MIKVDKNKCIGCGTCVVLCEKCFQIGSDGKAEVISQDCDAEKIKEVIETCATDAITKE